jgi:hypothetical protein
LFSRVGLSVQGLLSFFASGSDTKRNAMRDPYPANTVDVDIPVRVSSQLALEIRRGYKTLVAVTASPNQH